VKSDEFVDVIDPTDPVCGMKVGPNSEFQAAYEKQEYSFCSMHCLNQFVDKPWKYTGAGYYACLLHPEVEQPEPGICPHCTLKLAKIRVPSAGTKWVCPFHPDKLYDAPGKCPIYGLALVPEVPGRYYTCPLHPNIKQLEPGTCPKCEMRLKPAWAPVALTRTEWYCPRHPENVRSEAGTCPRCGLDLQPRVLPAKTLEKIVEKARARTKKAQMLCPRCGIEIEAGLSDVHDPVCGMNVARETPYRTEYKGREYLFCSPGCRAKFLEDPDRYTKAVELQ